MRNLTFLDPQIPKRWISFFCGHGVGGGGAAAVWQLCFKARGSNILLTKLRSSNKFLAIGSTTSRVVVVAGVVVVAVTGAAAAVGSSSISSPRSTNTSRLTSSKLNFTLPQNASHKTLTRNPKPRKPNCPG